MEPVATSQPPIPPQDAFAARGGQSYEDLLETLCTASVNKRFEAYRDIDWDHPDMHIDPADPRWELGQDHPLGKTRWYREQPAETRARIGLHLVASFALVGSEFEAILSRGLLRFAATRPTGSMEYRYAYHELIEESHHSLMFQEFVRRTTMPVGGLPKKLERPVERVVKLGSRFPELLFIFALGGEDPIDHVQREGLRNNRDGMHPLLRRICQIHITEEARHVAFARAYLRHYVPKLGPTKKFAMSLGAPFILSQMSRLMLQPSQHMMRLYDIPEEVIDEAYRNNPEHQRAVNESLKKVRELCEELGLMNPVSLRLWRRAGLVEA